MCWLKSICFGYGFYLMAKVRNVKQGEKFKHESIPNLGTQRDVNNSIIKFDNYWK